MISVCCPTRGRPVDFASMRDSALDLADRPRHVEIVAYVDEDDPKLFNYFTARARILTGPRVTHSDGWNKCAAHARGEILMECGDDIRFRTPGWDTIVEHAFAQVPDRIVLVHGDDGGDHEQTVGTHPFLHRRWVAAVGYLTPPGFVSDFTDTWLDELAVAIDRKVRVPIVTEHLHPLWGKGELDETHRERLARHEAERPDLLYASLAEQRQVDVEKLRAVMATV